jgi:hypothetical protein
MHHFQVAVADRPHAVDTPVQGLMRSAGIVASEKREQIDAVELSVRIDRAARSRDTGRHYVELHDRLLIRLASRQTPLPLGNEWQADAPFSGRVFLAAEHAVSVNMVGRSIVANEEEQRVVLLS